eukprot:31178-Pelagococcus_subviridis.AAC.22
MRAVFAIPLARFARRGVALAPPRGRWRDERESGEGGGGFVDGCGGVEGASAVVTSRGRLRASSKTSSSSRCFFVPDRGAARGRGDASSSAPPRVAAAVTTPPTRAPANRNRSSEDAASIPPDAREE